MRQHFAGLWIAVQLGIISLWLISCQPATTSSKPPVTFTSTMQPSATPSATPTLQPAPTLTATVTFEGEGRSVGMFGAGFFSGVFRSPDGKRIFAIMNRQELRWYNAKTLEQEGAVDLGRDVFAPDDIVFGPDSNLAVVVDYSNLLMIDIKHQKIIETLYFGARGYSGNVQFTPNGNFLFYQVYYLSSHSSASSIGVWDVEHQKDNRYLWQSGDGCDFTAPDISSDGKWVAAGCGSLLQIRDIQTGKVIFSNREHTNDLISVAFSKDATHLLSVDRDGEIHLWDCQSDKSLHTLIIPKKLLEDATIDKISFADDDHALLEFHYFPADRSALSRLINLETDEITTAPVAPLPILDTFAVELHRRGYSQSSWGDAIIGISPDRRTLAVGSGTILLWDIPSQKLINTLESPLDNKFINEIKFDPTGQKLAGVTGDDQVLLWDLISTAQPNLARIIGTQDQNSRQGLSFSPDGTLLAVGHGTDVEIWDVETARLIKTLQAGGYGNINYVFGTEFLADGHSLYVILDLPELHQYSGRPDRKGIQLWNIEKGQLINQRNLPDSNGYLIAFHWPLLALHNESDVTYADDWIEIWNVQTGKFQKLPASFDIAPVAFSDDLKLLFARDYSIDALYIWQVESGKLVYISKGYSKYYNPALLGSSNFLASSERGFVRLFDIAAIIEHAYQPDIPPVPLPTP